MVTSDDTDAVDLDPDADVDSCDGGIDDVADPDDKYNEADADVDPDVEADGWFDIEDDDGRDGKYKEVIADPDPDPDCDGKYKEADEEEEHKGGRQGRHFLDSLFVSSAFGLK